MIHIRRLAAAFLLILMVPSLALSAMPLRYCVGPWGHQAIEFVIDGVAHGGSHASHSQAAQDVEGCDDASTVEFSDVDKCIDTALMDTASAPPSVDLKQLPLSGLFAQLSLATIAPSTVVLDRPSISNGQRHLHVDPRIALRRTVVLLI